MDTEELELPKAEVAVMGDVWFTFRSQLEPLIKTAETLEVTDAKQTAQMRLARETRLALKKLRVAIDHKRLELVDDYKKKAKEIDTKAKDLRELIEPMEARLLEQEEFAEREEKRLQDERGMEREKLLAPFVLNPLVYPLAKMGQDEFDELLSGAKAAHQTKIESAQKAEEARLAKEKADSEERERIRQENARLKKEAEDAAAAAKAAREKAEAERRAVEEQAHKEREAAAAKAKSERDALEAKMRAEQEAQAAAAKAEREKAEAAAKKERDAMAAKLAEERAARDKMAAEVLAAAKKQQEAERAEKAKRETAAKAPDKEKLAAFAEAVRSLPVPELTSEPGKALTAALLDQTEKFAQWVDKKAATL